MAKNRRYNRSRQRDRILELLRETGDHPTADWLYTQLKDEFPNLSVGTIYRNLNILLDQGLIKKIDFGSTFDRFEANTAPHYHFICDRCGSIIDLDLPIDPDLDSRVNDRTPYTALRHKIEFFGLCNRCSHMQ
ncbi:transcriptional repressor [Marispirochaeta aestuarii]|uniref:Fur family transcriptional regulator n=1 Tax=Marispirochaeta aestuarii TaxID=1963862 RepID=UPI0029C7FA3B|nr:transcriptional repressor [Marispirochaeta aestuarii]